MACCGGRAKRMEESGKTIVYYHGNEKFYRIRGAVTQRTYVFRARGSEILMDTRDFEAFEVEFRRVISKSTT